MAYSILVVDDDPKILKILQHTFSKEGFKVAIAASGEEVSIPGLTKTHPLFLGFIRVAVLLAGFQLSYITH